MSNVALHQYCGHAAGRCAPLVRNAETALADRRRLEVLEQRLRTDAVAASDEFAAASAALDQAEADALLAEAAPPLGESTHPSAVALDAVRARVEQAKRELARVEAALRAVPVKLQEADARIAEANAALEATITPIKKEALALYTAELGAAVRDVSKALKAWYALSAAGFGASHHLADIVVPHPERRRRALLRGHVLQVDDASVLLNEIRRDDVASAELHAMFAPLKALIDQLASHMQRIHTDQHRSQIAENERRRSAGPAITHSTPGGASPAAPAVASGPPARFVPRSWVGDADPVLAQRG